MYIVDNTPIMPHFGTPLLMTLLAILNGALAMETSPAGGSLLFRNPHSPSAGKGLLRRSHKGKHGQKFLNMMELMDPLESRKIDPIMSQSELIDQVNYLRSYAVEECRELVCSPRGKARFSDCAASLLSASKECRPGCQDHLQMWTMHRCYLAETFDCDGNIGPSSVNANTMVFNYDGPQTLAEFTTSVKSVFEPKGVNCECCNFSDVLITK